MTVIISRTIRKKELRKKDEKKAIEIIIKAFQKGIYTTINKGENLPRRSHLIKIYATTIEGAKRIVYLVNSETGDAFFLFYRSKNDSIGKNITIQNPEFRDNLVKYIHILLRDIEEGNIDIYDENEPNKDN